MYHFVCIYIYILHDGVTLVAKLKTHFDSCDVKLSEALRNNLIKHRMVFGYFWTRFTITTVNLETMALPTNRHLIFIAM